MKPNKRPMHQDAPSPHELRIAKAMKFCDALLAKQIELNEMLDELEIEIENLKKASAHSICEVEKEEERLNREREEFENREKIIDGIKGSKEELMELRAQLKRDETMAKLEQYKRNKELLKIFAELSDRSDRLENEQKRLKAISAKIEVEQEALNKSVQRELGDQFQILKTSLAYLELQESPFFFNFYFFLTVLELLGAFDSSGLL